MPRNLQKKDALFVFRPFSEKQKNKFLCVLSAFCGEIGTVTRIIKIYCRKYRRFRADPRDIRKGQGLNQETGLLMESPNDETAYRGPFEPFDLKNNALGQKHINFKKFTKLLYVTRDQFKGHRFILPLTRTEFMKHGTGCLSKKPACNLFWTVVTLIMV